MRVPPVVFDLPTIRIEHIICEIIDNSLDAKASEILVELSQDDVDKESFKFEVWDDGVGISSESHLMKAFEIGRPIGESGDYEAEDIGMYNVGMKLAVLSKFNQLHVLSNVVGDLGRHAMYPRSANIDYDHTLGRNPSSSPLKKFDSKAIFKSLSKTKYNTYVCARDVRKKLLVHGKKDFQYLETGFCQHLGYFLGITYKRAIESGVDIKIKCPFLEQILEVEPLDPFWENLTPEAFDKFAKSTKDEELAQFCRSISKFATLIGQADDFMIPGKGRVKVEPFIVPSSNSRAMIKKYFPSLSLFKETKAFNGPGNYGRSKSGSTALASTNWGGYYFYKGKRCINFGGNPQNNSGFYSLPGGPTATWSFMVKIRISYENRLDSHLELHPNKNMYTKIDPLIWEGIHAILKNKCGGKTYSQPFDKLRPFFEEGKKDQFRSLDGRSKLEVKCGGCETMHAKTDICPLEPCSVCKQKGIGYALKNCAYVCKLCNTAGHLPSQCKTNCKYCGYHGGHRREDCEKFCEICNSGLPCSCACTRCEVSPCKCQKVCTICFSEPCTCKGRINSYHIEGSSVKMILNRSNRSESISQLKDALNHLQITLDDLR